MEEEQPGDQEGRVHDQEDDMADEVEQPEEREKSADNQEEHPGEQEEQDDQTEEQPNEGVVEEVVVEVMEQVIEEVIQEDRTDVHDSEKDGKDDSHKSDEDKKGDKDVNVQAQVEQFRNKQEERLLHQREEAGKHQSEEIEEPEEVVAQVECVSKDQPQEKLEANVFNDAGEGGRGQGLLKIAAERGKQGSKELRREEEQQFLKEEQLKNKAEQLRKKEEELRKRELEERPLEEQVKIQEQALQNAEAAFKVALKKLKQLQEETESKRQELEDQVKIQEQALQNAEAAFKVALKRKDGHVKEVTAELESFIRTKDEEEGKLRSQLKSVMDENAKLKTQLQKMQKNIQAAGVETSTSIRGGGARILTVKRRLDNPGGVGEEGEDVTNKVSTSEKREATTSNQEVAVRAKKRKGPIACDENENLDFSEEVDDEDVVEVKETLGQPMVGEQLKKVEKSIKIVMCKKCKEVLPTKEFLKLHTCGNISSVGNTSSRRKQ